MKYIYWLKECSKEHLTKIGGKNVGLGEMIQIGIPVSPGFAITTTYKESLFKDSINKKIQGILNSLKSENIASIEEVSKNIRQLIESVSISNNVKKAIRASLQILEKECNTINPPLAVRSSATFRGQTKCELCRTTRDLFMGQAKRRHIKIYLKCWSSLFTPQAIS